MFENRRLNRLLETGEYELPDRMRSFIAEAAHWVAPLVTFFVSILVAGFGVWVGEYFRGSDGYRAFIGASAFSLGCMTFLLVTLGSFLMFMERVGGPTNWHNLVGSCIHLGLTLDELARKPLALQTQLCERHLRGLASKIMLAEQAFPGEQYHTVRVNAKNQFEDAFRNFWQVGWLPDNDSYGRFFKSPAPLAKSE